MNRITRLIAVLLLGTAGPALAEAPPAEDAEPPAAESGEPALEEFPPQFDEPRETVEYDRPGTYLGLSGVYAIEDFSEFIGTLPADNSWGLDVYVGQRLSSRFAVEAEWEWLDEFEITGAGNVDGYFLSLNGKLFVLRGPVQPYLKGGIGFASFDVPALPGTNLTANEDDFASRWGGGIDIYATKSLVASVSGEYVIGVAGLGFLRYASIGWGLQYRF